MRHSEVTLNSAALLPLPNLVFALLGHAAILSNTISRGLAAERFQLVTATFSAAISHPK